MYQPSRRHRLHIRVIHIAGRYSALRASRARPALWLQQRSQQRAARAPEQTQTDRTRRSSRTASHPQARCTSERPCQARLRYRSRWCAVNEAVDFLPPLTVVNDVDIQIRMLVSASVYARTDKNDRRRRGDVCIQVPTNLLAYRIGRHCGRRLDGALFISHGNAADRLDRAETCQRPFHGGVGPFFLGTRIGQ